MIAKSDLFARDGRVVPSLPLGGWLTQVQFWLERRRQRRSLLELNDHMLKDIGLNRVDAWQESQKPFWRP